MCPLRAPGLHMAYTHTRRQNTLMEKKSLKKSTYKLRKGRADGFCLGRPCGGSDTVTQSSELVEVRPSWLSHAHRPGTGGAHKSAGANPPYLPHWLGNLTLKFPKLSRGCPFLSCLEVWGERREGRRGKERRWGEEGRQS